MDNTCKNCGEELTMNMVQVGPGVHVGSCEWEYFHAKTKEAIKIRPEGDCGGWAVIEPRQLIDHLVDEEIYEVQLVKMSKGEFENLPEHEGF